VEHPHVTTSSSFQCVVVPGGHRRLASASPTPRSSPDRRWQQEQMATSVPLRTLSPTLELRPNQQRRPCDGGGGLGGCTRPASSLCLLGDGGAARRGGRASGRRRGPRVPASLAAARGHLSLPWRSSGADRGAPPRLQHAADGGGGPTGSTKKSHPRAEHLEVSSPTPPGHRMPGWAPAFRSPTKQLPA
jgi:hypothetical protein